MADDNEKAKALVLSVLGDAVIPKINFTVGSWSVKGDFYANVAKAVTDNKITVLVDKTSAAGTIAAAYFPTLPVPNKPGKEMYDVLVLRVTELGNTMDQAFANAAVIIHECTHAGIDLAGWTGMSHLHHEVIAYIAGAQGIWLKVVSMGGHPEKITFPTSALQQAAWFCARDLAQDGKVSVTSLVLLCGAIALNPDYSAKVFKPITNDGVGKAWKL